jgi:outer membrane protein OmpA-like peptidoglycan-associated protein/tetratricopeptide (TPR) repeat protein
MSNKIIYALAAAFLIVAQLEAQPGKVRETWEESLEKGDLLMEQNSYYTAAEKYRAVLKQKSKDADVVFKLAEAYRLARNYDRAATYYARLKRLVERSDNAADFPLLDFKLGQMQKQSGSYDEAEEAFFLFKQNYKGADSARWLQLADIELAGIKLARQPAAAAVKIANTSQLNRRINSKYTEFAPLPYGKNQLLFSSLKANELIVPSKSETKAKLYTAVLDDNNAPKEVEEFGNGLNTNANHVGHGSFSKDGQRFYFTLCGYEIEENRVKCEIYKAQKNGTAWQSPERLGDAVNMEGYESTMPHVAQGDGAEELLYFASDRPGGQGGLDLWVAVGRGGGFQSPINLGPTINTPGDEASPFVDDAKGYEDLRPMLYFSSNGHPGFGGFDVFKSFKNNTNFTDWGKVENAGNLLNSPADELYFVMDDSKTKGFIVSNRDGSYSIAGKNCCDDIYVLELGEPKENVVYIADALGTVYDDKEKAMVGAKVTLYELDGNKRKKVANISTKTMGYVFENLKLDRNYILTAEKDGFAAQEHAFNTKGLKQNQKFRKDFYLKKQETPVEDPDAALYVEGQVFSDKGREGGVSVLNNATVEIIRINVKNGQEVSFKSLTTSGQGNYRTKLPDGYRYKLIATAPGHLAASESIDGTGITGTVTKKVDFTLRVQQTDVAFKIDNIYYDFDKATLRDESIPNLQVLLGILNDNPSIRIELGAHTDSKGADDYNMKLSQRRAQSVVDWLVGQGIAADRLVAKGYGETQPVAPNENPDGSDNPDGRQLNRRTEFKLLE